MSNQIKLEAGRFYRLRSEQVVYIISKIKPDSLYQFQGTILGTTGRLQWSESGFYDEDIQQHPYDILKEVKLIFK